MSTTTIAALYPQLVPQFRVGLSGLIAELETIGIRVQLADAGGVRSEADTVRAIKARDADYAAYVARAKKAGKTPLGIYEAWDVGDDGKPAPRPIAPYGSSFHNYACAGDLIVVARPQNMTVAQAQAKIGELAPKHGLRWGGNWPGNKRDPRHVELAVTLAEARKLYEQFTGKPIAGGGASSSSSSSGVIVGLLIAIALGGTLYLVTRGSAGWRSLS